MKLLVIGAGMMARAVCYDFVRQPDVTEVHVTDKDPKRLSGLRRWLTSPKLVIHQADAADIAAMEQLMASCQVAVSCVPYFYNLDLTRAAIAAKTHFCDLGGNNKVVDRQIGLDARARKAGVAIVPDCGLAPGMVSTLAADGYAGLDKTTAIHIRVGGLPRRPRPPLGYGLVFSANGLINEYAEPCLVLRDGKVDTVPPLADLEELSFPAPFGRLEAFNTSGGSSRLPLTFAGRVQTLDYKTIRYPGHCRQLQLLRDLGLFGLTPVKVNGQSVVPRQLLINRLEAVLPRETDDVVLLRVDVIGTRRRRPCRIRYQLIDYADARTGLTAMMRTTGFAAAVVALMLARGGIALRGAFTGETGIPGSVFINELRARGIDLRVSRR